MSTVRGKSTQVTDVSYFKPNNEKTDVITFLEKWAATILKPKIPDLLKDAKRLDNDTRKGFKCAKKTFKFKFVFSDKDSIIIEQEDSEHNTIFNTSPNRSSRKSDAHLLLSISKVFQKVVTTLKKISRKGSNSGVARQ